MVSIDNQSLKIELLVLKYAILKYKISYHGLLFQWSISHLNRQKIESPM
jgi:hypothetical protein